MTEVYKIKTTPVAERVSELLARMTVEEKIGQLTQLPANMEGNTDKLEEWHIGSYLHCTGDDALRLQERAAKTRLGIPLIFGIDAIHGHCFDNDATVFPTQLSASSSWDRELTQEMARITAKEVRATGIHWTFSPVLCVGRDARWGRVNETYGEDAWLIGEMAAETIKGYQGDDFASPDSILACAKHYVAYGETVGGRDSYEADVSRRKLKSIFLPPFKKAVQKSNVASLMTGYHSNDGLPCTADKWLLTDVAKDDWGLNGFIVTDWDNVKSLHTKQKVSPTILDACYRSLVAGNDMMMSTPEFYDAAVELVKTEKVDIEIVDRAVSRILTKKFELGLFDEMRFYAPERNEILGISQHLDVAMEASLKSIVMLKNDGILPLEAKKDLRVLVAGPNADDVIAQLGDWSFGSMQAGATNDQFHRDQTVTILQAFQAASEQYGFNLEFVKGADCIDADFEERDALAAALENADVAIACVGDTIALHGEFHDRANLDLTGKQQSMLEQIKASGVPLIVNFIASKPMTIPWISENANAVLCGFNPGTKGGEAIKRVIFGEHNPSGKLTISFPHHVGQLPVFYNKFEGWHAQISEKTGNQERYIDMPELPLYSFGEGISYSSFEYSNAQLKQTQIAPHTDVEVSVTVTNTSVVDGTEIVQVYFNDHYSTVTTPIKQICGFERVDIKAGESVDVIIKVAFEDLALVNANLEEVVEAGTFSLMIGSSSKDSDLTSLEFEVLRDTKLA
ncbi:glycoside hydrolase family 3 C-terminal domain-containing protein [Vibrio parahaemolyticus]|nr:glycoside hydrolase family 3 C-terminal domain-containing protein [Vibrio parahaemolyticus]